MYATSYTPTSDIQNQQLYQQITPDLQNSQSLDQQTNGETSANVTNYFYGNYSQYAPFHMQSQPTEMFPQQNYFVNYYNNQDYYGYQQEKHYTPYPSEYNFNYTKPSSPPSDPANTAVHYAKASSFTDSTTPEKSVNDSGIDLISPQVESKIISQYNQQSTVQEIINETDSEESEDEENESPIKVSKKVSDTDTDNASKPPKPYLEIIADAVLSSKVKMMQLHEIYQVMENKFQYFAKNVNKSWRNSVRHNLSLNECFVKAGRGSNGKGNYWKIHPLCEKEFIRGNFRRKSFKQLIRAGGGRNPSAPQVPFGDYALNYRNMPPTLPSQLVSQFNQGTVQMPSFNYQFLNQQYQQSDINTAYPSETKRPGVQRYSPY